MPMFDSRPSPNLSAEDDDDGRGDETGDAVLHEPAAEGRGLRRADAVAGVSGTARGDCPGFVR